MLETLLDSVVELLIPLLAALLTALVGYAVAYLKKQTEKISNETVRDSLMAALSEADMVARDAIMATKQQVVDDLKAAKEDGKLTPEEAKAAMNNAYNYFVNSISKDSQKVLLAAIGPFENWLEEFIEAKLGEVKQFNVPLS